jgi:hypothetical protein
MFAEHDVRHYCAFVQLELTDWESELKGLATAGASGGLLVMYDGRLA